MKIFVCVKQVPDTRGKAYIKKDGSLDRAKMSTIINPDDLGAVETALQLKEKFQAEKNIRREFAQVVPSFYPFCD